MYRTFTRTWWRENPDYPNGLEPCAGEKHIVKRGILSEGEAREMCRVYRKTYKPGRLSLKMEYERT